MNIGGLAWARFTRRPPIYSTAPIVVEATRCRAIYERCRRDDRAAGLVPSSKPQPVAWVAPRNEKSRIIQRKIRLYATICTLVHQAEDTGLEPATAEQRLISNQLPNHSVILRRCDQYSDRRSWFRQVQLETIWNRYSAGRSRRCRLVCFRIRVQFLTH